jgi:hypothetical protein
MQPDNSHQANHNVRQVQLPSGKVIEVVYFADRPVSHGSAVSGATTRSRRHADPDRELHLCPECGSGMVYPIDWSEADSSRWEILLRCPDCEWTETGVFSQAAVEQFDSELDRGGDALLADLQHLVHANMAEDIERFVFALQNDHVVPADF